MANKNQGTYKFVIVESPTKAKTIRKFLGKDYIVESCMGHIRDLPQSTKEIPEKFKKEKWAQLGVNVDKHFEPIYQVPKNKTKVVKVLQDKLKEANELYLATDEDREGESISWHLKELLKPKVPIKRMVFHEITKEAIQKALKETREIDMNLVQAQEARRILDRLVGYTISPLIWKKVAYGLSAGRVQSVAVKLIVEKEFERLKFKKGTYWGITAYHEKDNIKFESRLQEYKNKKVVTGKDFDPNTGAVVDPQNFYLIDENKAKNLVEIFQRSEWIIENLEEKPIQRRPYPPFITSTLQQEASRKLGMSSREAMQVAQKLYEQGFITYMRTDSTFLSSEAIKAARAAILSKYGNEYLPATPRDYASKKIKGAQEAHEAIRPAGQEFIDPENTGLLGDQFQLYDLIWKRTMASQMVDARQKQMQIKIRVTDALFAASGLSIEFPGFLRAYVEGSDDPDAELLEREVRLPLLKLSESISPQNIIPKDHETKPPARYTEASLIQKMEKEGIGRPSTYASIMGTIVDRGYIKKQSNALVPTFTALVVSKLLSNYLPEYVDLKFTSLMEESLDKIAEGELESIKYLEQVYHGPKGLKATVDKQEKKIDPQEARKIELEGFKNFTFHVGRFGAYLTTQKEGKDVSASLPENESPADLTIEKAEKLIEQKINGADSLGEDPVTQLPVYVLTGRFGPYVQLGESQNDEAKPKRMSLPAGVTPEQVDLPMALRLLELPKTLGIHPVSNKPVQAGLGRFGPYVVHQGEYRSIPKSDSVFNMNLEKALELLNQPKKSRGKAVALKEFPATLQFQQAIHLFNGPYGPYLKCGKVNASLPEGVTPESITAESALEILQTKAGGTLGAEASPRKEPKKTSKILKPLTAPKPNPIKSVKRVRTSQADLTSKTPKVNLKPKTKIKPKNKVKEELKKPKTPAQKPLKSKEKRTNT